MIFAHQPWTVTVMYNDDIESDDPLMWACFASYSGGVYTPLAQPAWFVINNSTVKQLVLKFTNPPQPPTPGVPVLYHIQLSIWDIYNIATPRLYYFTVTVNSNYPP